jgi:murein DD-endopeptidase MepM/ murein hydrolase activator NlpD
LNTKFGLTIKIFIFVALSIATIIYFGLYRLVESNKPTILVQDNIYWNLENSINVAIYDDSDISDYKISLRQNGKVIPIKVKVESNNKRYLKLTVSYAGSQNRQNMLDTKSALLTIKATDSSKFNFFSGNIATKKSMITFDVSKPSISIISQSETITKGGSALIIFKANDINIKDVYIDSNYGKRFETIKFYKDNVYITMVAWPTHVEHSKFELTAVDKAGNIQKEQLPINNKVKIYKVSTIELKQEFLDGKVSSLFDKLKPSGTDGKGISGIDKFIFINEKIRKQNEKYIHSKTLKIIEDKYVNFNLKAFRPLERSAVVAKFGGKREFYHSETLRSISYHMGVDIASIKKSKIFATNEAIVVDIKDNGIYGNMPILYFGLGLYGIYGHCSSINIKKGFSIEKDATIGRTGKSGLALGDHVHFGVIIQGIEVRPNEWMNQRWIDTNINSVIKKATLILEAE